MGNGVPLLNDYKQEFFWKRFPQTVLGGPKLRLGYDAPVYVYTNQVVIFLIPWIIGGLLSLFVELDFLKDYAGSAVFAAIMFIYVLLIQLISLGIRSKQSSVIKITNQNILAEDDEIDFESCCGVETLEFIIPGKKFKVNVFFHALFSAVMCGIGLWYLLPSTSNALYNNTAVTVILFIFGWITLCIAQYSLTVAPPPEPAVFRTTDPYEITPLMRPFYVFLFEVVFLVAMFYSDFYMVDWVLHILFPILPVFWILGCLPPVDALLSWTCEQILIFLLGGTAMANDLRLFCMFLVSITVFVIVFLIAFYTNNTMAIVLTAACTGYLLSLDLPNLASQLISKCRKRPTIEHKPVGFGWSTGWKECLVYFGMFLVVGAISGVCSNSISSSNTSIYNALGYAIMGLLVLAKLLTDAQLVFVGFGLCRNPLYPSSTQSMVPYQKRKKVLHGVGYIRRIILDAVGPLVMVAYLSLFMIPSTSSINTFSLSLATVRALRWCWQSTTHSLLEISIVHLINMAVGVTTGWWYDLGMGLQLLLIGLIRDRFYQLLDQLYFIFAVLITSYSEKKQRRSSTIPMIIVSLCIFPIILAVMFTCVALSAPLLPLFTLPVFILGFPRPLRSWPGPVGSSANICPDTVYYQQVTPQLVSSLRMSIASGSLGDVNSGCHYLLRFQDRMVWLQVLEKGYGYCTFSVKGLEMQETSCHTVEAGRVDEIFETAFDNERGGACYLNSYPFHTLTALDAVPVNTYSDARNVLTGIIDSRETLANVGKCFLQSLVWVMLHHNVQKSQKRQDTQNGTAVEKHDTSQTSLVHHVNTPDTVPDTWTSRKDSGKPESVKTRPQSRAKSVKSWNSSFGSLDSWADDNDSLALDTIGDKTKKVNLLGGLETHKKEPTRKEAELPGLLTNLNDDDNMDDLFKELDFGMPAIDKSIAQKQQHSFGLPALHSNSGIKLAGSIQFSSPYSSKLSLPLKWREIPIESNRIASLLKDFPQDWFKHVLTLLDLSTSNKSSSEVAADIANDSVLSDTYRQLVMACYAVVNVFGLTGTDAVSMGASHVYRTYTGDVPWSPSLDWLTEDSELLELVLKAYRFGFKLAYDQAVLGEIEGTDELVEYLQEYENDWYIGCEKDKEWSSGVLQGKNNLFSLMYDPVDGVYNGRVLSKQPVMAYVGRLNAEVIRGYWASLSQELFYYTNDDEERYSIQAHPVLLRNLTVQSADPPLGYPIYASPPISIPTL
ncbi:pecanex-like protein 4 [Saccoglossus kowalevskii]|uniref:Pecanex-like protein n=1 Tax=Saccoglossus kowalevskii TaxID=10224 RepID=A0ABM0GQN3_SACKO|nr:PREDICTED: pecanex-like protein 4-like [Saccoglossus kowalevskii]